MARSAKWLLSPAALLLQLLKAEDNYTSDSCAAPIGVANSEAVPCGEGLLIPGGGNCTAMCQQGYKSSELSLACGSNGTLAPLTFECEELPCFAPVVQHGDPSGLTCVEGLELTPGNSACTPICQCGYVASEVSLSCSKGELYPETFFCNETRCVNVISTQYALQPKGTSGQVELRCAPPCMEPQQQRNWDYLAGLDAMAEAQAPEDGGPAASPVTSLLSSASLGGYLLSEVAPEVDIAPLDLSIPTGWCHPRCGRFVAAYAEMTPGLERVARGLFSHLPCFESLAWRPVSVLRPPGVAPTEASLARADVLLTTLQDMAGLSASELQNAGFSGAVVLVDFGCIGHTVEGIRPPALQSWEDRTLCVGADRKAAATVCKAFLEVPPGAMAVAMENKGDLPECMDPLRAESRQSPADFDQRKLLAYVDDECDPTAEAFFDSVAADSTLLQLGAVEALGRCHGTHPELVRNIEPDNVSAELGAYKYVIAFEKSADSGRQCPRYIASTAFEALRRQSIPVLWQPIEGFAIINPAAVVEVPRLQSVDFWKWELIGVALDAARVQARLQAPALRQAARSRWFSWADAVRGIRTDLAREATALADSILHGSPHRRCVDLNKARPSPPGSFKGSLKVTV